MLPTDAAVAQIVIAKLEQPNRYDYALQCKCGFQSHGYANEDKSLGDEAELGRQAARTHLINRHGAKPSETEARIRVASFAIAGGMNFAQIDLRMTQLGKAGVLHIMTAPPTSEALADKANIENFGVHADTPGGDKVVVHVPKPATKPPEPAAQIKSLKEQFAKQKVDASAKPNEVQTGGVTK